MMHPIRLFYSYAPKDESFRRELEKHLSMLRWQGLIAEWDNRNISAGTEWAREIDSHLNAADIILLLISSDFLASDYCYSIEVKRALERHDAGEARVIPVLLRPVDLEGTSFSKLQALPTNRKPITKWPKRDDAFLDVVQGIRRVVGELQRGDPGESHRSDQISSPVLSNVFLFNQQLPSPGEFFAERENAWRCSIAPPNRLLPQLWDHAA